MNFIRGAFVPSSIETPARISAGTREPLPGTTLGSNLAAPYCRCVRCADSCSADHAAGGRPCPHAKPGPAFSECPCDCDQRVRDHCGTSCQSQLYRERFRRIAPCELEQSVLL